MTVLRPLIVPVVAALAAQLVCGCASPEPSRNANLVLIVMDTVRADHLSLYGYGRETSPYLQQLAAQGTSYERAWSSSSWTLPAHASMFTGLLPSVHGATQSHRALRGDPELLAELLVQAGYQSAGFSNNPWVSQKTGLAAGFDEFQELWRARQRPATLLVDPSSRAVQGWFEQGYDPDKPFFLFVNLMEAHGPYEPGWRYSWPTLGGPLAVAEATDDYQSIDELGLVRSWYAGPQPVADRVLRGAMDLYDAEIRQVDASVRRIVELVDRYSDPQTTTVLVTTDHGEHFGEHGHVGHAFSVFEPLLRVALVARGPGFQPGVVQRAPVQLVDLFPTILGAATLQAGAGPGLDLRGELPDSRGLAASYAYPDQVLGTFPRALRDSDSLRPHRRSLAVGLDGRYKFILDSNGQEQLFDLWDDPQELHPLTALDPQVLDPLRHLAAAALLAPVDAPASEVDGPDVETQEALRELGYIE